MMRFDKILFVVILCSPVAFGCHSQNSKTDQEVSFRLARQSDDLLRAGNLDSAQVLINKALEIYPGNYIAYNNRAYIKIKQGKPEQEVITDYRKAIESWPEYDIGLYSLINYYFLINDYKNTVNLSPRYLSLQIKKELDPVMLEHIYSITGIAEKHLLQFDNAIADLEKSIQLNPYDKFSHEELGECYYYGRNDIPSAIAELTKALEIDSTYYQAYYLREHCYLNSKPALKKQATSDSINAGKFDTSHTTKPSLFNVELENARKSLNAEVLRASAYYDTIVAVFRPNKILQQKLIDNLTQAFQIIQNDNSAVIDTKYLQKITNAAIASNKMLLQKINKIQEVDSTINCKKKLIDDEKLFADFMINTMPDVLKILDQKSDPDRFAKGLRLLQPILPSIKQKGVEFYNAEEALMDKYSLH